MQTLSPDRPKESFIKIDKDSDFPLCNLPYGVFSAGSKKHIGAAIGDFVLDLTQLESAGLLKTDCFNQQDINAFIASGHATWQKVRKQLQDLLSLDSVSLQSNQVLRDAVLIPRSRVEMHIPLSVGDYTDFYSSKEHAINVGSMFRDPENALLENWLHLPVAYHGRASSIVVSGTPIRRPIGQIKPDDKDAPIVAASKLLDFEIELGCVIGKENNLGSPVAVQKASEHIFGFVLINDWSARDIQKWEYVPLGPFLAKSFATSISPWVVPMAALEPFRVPGPEQDPKPLEYLRSSGNWAFDISLEASLSNDSLSKPHSLCKTNSKYLYWNICQQIAHHTSNGCNLKIGDLLGSGTISGPTASSYGSLLELCWKGTKPIELPDGSKRTFLEDGDQLSIKGVAQNADCKIGFGEVTGKILEAMKGS